MADGVKTKKKALMVSPTGERVWVLEESGNQTVLELKKKGWKLEKVIEFTPGDDYIEAGAVVYGRIRRQLTAQDLARMNVPKALWNARLDGIQDEEVRGAIRNFLAKIIEMMQTGTGLIILGAEGVGKSGAASVIAKEAARWAYSVHMITHGDMQDLRFDDRERADGLMLNERIKTVDLLVLDNFNEDFLEDRRFGPRELERLISHRVANRLSTIFTGRLKPSQLAGLKANTVMKETMVGVVIEGKDLRSDLCDAARQRVFGSKDNG